MYETSSYVGKSYKYTTEPKSVSILELEKEDSEKKSDDPQFLIEKQTKDYEKKTYSIKIIGHVSKFNK